MDKSAGWPTRAAQPCKPTPWSSPCTAFMLMFETLQLLNQQIVDDFIKPCSATLHALSCCGSNNTFTVNCRISSREKMSHTNFVLLQHHTHIQWALYNDPLFHGCLQRQIAWLGAWLYMHLAKNRKQWLQGVAQFFCPYTALCTAFIKLMIKCHSHFQMEIIISNPKCEISERRFYRYAIMYSTNRNSL